MPSQLINKRKSGMALFYTNTKIIAFCLYQFDRLPLKLIDFWLLQLNLIQVWPVQPLISFRASSLN